MAEWVGVWARARASGDLAEDVPTQEEKKNNTYSGKAQRPQYGGTYPISGLNVGDPQND